MKHIVMFSYGIGSWAAGKLVVRERGPQDVLLLNADTLMEDEDTYRWGEEAAANVGGSLVTVADGRDPWQVFHDERFLGNTRADPCSKVLKRELARRWVQEHFRPEEVTLYVGIHFSEQDRFRKIEEAWRPYTVKAPLCDVRPLIGYQELHDWAAREGLKPQRLYLMGFPHANCGGFCVKAGQAHFAHLLKTMPDRYAYHEMKEQELRAYLGKDVAILRDRRGGATRPLTLKEFRERLEVSGEHDPFDWGGCGCFAGVV